MLLTILSYYLSNNEDWVHLRIGFCKCVRKHKFGSHVSVMKPCNGSADKTYRRHYLGFISTYKCYEPDRTRH